MELNIAAAHVSRERGSKRELSLSGNVIGFLALLRGECQEAPLAVGAIIECTSQPVRIEVGP
jgi:hypothetical protein